ncbi:MAG: HTH domain-containing protein, partial [Candidatus Marinimicrobia bacterium]|nr:HTH domain-containing protein [Candidatus Neomarinimicrobiota bacterium]
DQIIDFIQSEGKTHFEDQFHKTFNFDKDYHPAKLDAFLKIAGISKTLSLLCEQAIITCAKFDGTERIKVLDRKDFDGDIVTNIDSAMHFLKRELQVEYVMTGEPGRQEIYEIPLEALREAVINAVTHRDYYFTGAHTVIELFDDRLEISNPGGLPRGLKKSDFGKRAVRRNQLIATLLHRIKFVENMGTGINKIKTLVKEANAPTPFFQFEEFYSIIFPRHTRHESETLSGKGSEMVSLITPNLSQNMSQKTPDKIYTYDKISDNNLDNIKDNDAEYTKNLSSKTSDKILALLNKHPDYTAQNLAYFLKISSRAVEKHLAKLKAGGRLKRLSSPRNGTWEVVKK